VTITAVVSRQLGPEESMLEQPYVVTFYDEGVENGILKTISTVAGAVVAALRGAGVVTVYDLTATSEESAEEETVV